MPNPNSADNIAKKAQDRKMRAALNADAAEAVAKGAAARADKAAGKPSGKTGTAADPVNQSKGFDPRTTQIGANRREALRSQLEHNLEDVVKGGDIARKAWVDLGRTLIDIRSTFVQVDKDGTAVVNADTGETALNKKAYGAWLEAEGYATGVLSNPNTRSAAVWLAENFAAVKAVPGVMKHAHPVHIQNAYREFTNWLASAPDSDPGEFVQRAAVKGGAAPISEATKAQFRSDFSKRLRRAMKGTGTIDDGYRGEGTPWQFKAMVDVLFRLLSEEVSERELVEAKLAAAEATIAGLKAKVDAGTPVDDADFEVVLTEETTPQARPMLLLSAPVKAKAVKLKAKAVKAKGDGNGKTKAKGKPKGEDAADALAAKAKAAKDAAKAGKAKSDRTGADIVDGDFTDPQTGDAI